MNWNSDMEAAPRDGKPFLATAEDYPLPAVVMVTGPVRDYANPDSPPKDWEVEAVAFNARSSTWRLSHLKLWCPIEPPEES